MTKTKTKTKTTEVVVERKHLADALLAVAPAVNKTKTSSLSVTRAVRLTAHKDQLRVAASDYEVYARASAPAVTAGPFDVAVPYKLLQPLLREAAGQLRLSVPEGTTDEMRVAWGRSVATLKTTALDDWAREPATYETLFTLTADDVANIRKLANFASRDEFRPILTTLRFSQGNTPAETGVVATDSYRLAVLNIDANDKLPKKPLLVPARIARFLPALMLATETVEVSAAATASNSRWVRFEGGDVDVAVLETEGEFPPFERLFPSATATVKFGVADLKAAVRATSVLAADTTVRLTLDTEKKLASITAIDHIAGELATELDLLDFTGDTPPATCGFNNKYLLTLLETLTGDTVTFQLAGTLQPALVREDPWTLLIMPVRL